MLEAGWPQKSRKTNKKNNDAHNTAQCSTQGSSDRALRDSTQGPAHTAPTNSLRLSSTHQSTLSRLAGTKARRVTKTQLIPDDCVPLRTAPGRELRHPQRDVTSCRAFLNNRYCSRGRRRSSCSSFCAFCASER